MPRAYVLDERARPKRRSHIAQGPGAKPKGWNYRVAWRRRGMQKTKYKHFFTFGPALDLWRALSHPEPWRFWEDWLGNPVRGEDPHCGGNWKGRCQPRCNLTIEQFIAERRRGLGRLIFCRLERQPTGPWEPMEDVWGWDDFSTKHGRRARERGSPPATVRAAPYSRQLYPAPGDPTYWLIPVEDRIGRDLRQIPERASERDPLTVPRWADPDVPF